MKAEVCNSIIEQLIPYFDGNQLKTIENAIYITIQNYRITKDQTESSLTADISPDVRAIKMFFVAKKIEGLTDRTLKHYRLTLQMILNTIQKPIVSITTDDIRIYFAMRKVTPVTANNERAVLSSFFTWLHSEEYITKNPMSKIKKIKIPKEIKKPFSIHEIEELRDATKNIREKAIIEVLFSTGMRCGEMEGIDRDDLNLEAGEVLVTGKGNKQRICYLNASAIKRLKDYLETRTDDYKPLFVSLNDKGKCTKGNRLMVSGIEITIRKLGKRAGINNVHPHRFRRTAATIALNRGMPIEQVQRMLGHKNIDTTLQYAIVADSTVKQTHERLCN